MAAARRIVYEEALRLKDEPLMRRLRKQMQGESRSEKDARTKTGILLRERAEEVRAEDAKRRRIRLEQEKEDAKDLEARALLRAKEETAAAEKRLAAMELARDNYEPLVF